ncbi:MAG TPA: hypothetical protein VFE54_08795 [Mucilaginibacter sp.]|jgi:hypothetical protein|nr:hypothetical protein [Mucilaginibacter sp.]
MKKILTIVCSAMVLLSISSCTKKYITPNNTESVYATLAPSDWSLYTDGKSYQAIINVADIDPNFASTGAVIVAISYSDGVYENLPEVYNGTAFSYVYNSGAVQLFSQSSDGTTAIAPTSTIKVKITLIATN